MSFMPEVKMDFIPDDCEAESDEETTTIDEFNEEKDKIQEEIYQTNLEVAEESQEMQEVKLPKAKSKRDDMNVNDIFNLPESTPPPSNIKLTKKGKPRKKRPPMSEEHKAKLALAREKAMAARKAKAQDRKENKALELEEKELLKKQKVKRVKKLKEEVEDNEEVHINSKTQALKEVVKEQSFTKKDLEEAQLQAIMNYEKIRKSRKEQKKIELEKNKEQEALRNQIRRAVAPPQEEYNPYSMCY